MNFFEAQGKAKHNTSVLVALFIIGVICMILITSFIIMPMITDQNGADFVFFSENFLISTLVVLVPIIIASYYKLHELSAGGYVVAEALGGRLIPHDTSNSKYRQLLNVVDEMSLASGISAPLVYVLEEEGVNAFAAGLSFDDAVIGVTQGALDAFEREELQGVIAHEFSHIFNGDMRLNIHMTGLLNGVMFIGLIGEEILKRQVVKLDSASKLSKIGHANMMLIPFAFIFSIMGFGGRLIAEKIQSLINQQREFLADASAVQFTRYPKGLVNALRKIGSSTSRINSSSAGIYSHFYFADGRSDNFNFSSHPKLDERILRLDPRWNGRYIKYTIKKEIYKKEDKSKTKEHVVEVVTTVTVLNAMQDIGNPSEQRVNQASILLDSISKLLKSMSKNPLTAQAVIYALLCSLNEEVREKQKVAMGECSKALPKQILLALVSIEFLERNTYLPLMRLCITSLKMMSLSQYKIFKECAKKLIELDDKISLFEWNMQHLVFTPLDIFYGLSKLPKEKYSHMGAIRDEVTLLISVLAKEQKDDDSMAQEAFNSAKTKVGATALKYVSNNINTYHKLEDAVLHLSSAKLGVRKKVLTMVIVALEHDGLINAEDLEMINAISLILRLPLPLILSSQA